MRKTRLTCIESATCNLVAAEHWSAGSYWGESEFVVNMDLLVRVTGVACVCNCCTHRSCHRNAAVVKAV